MNGLPFRYELALLSTLLLLVPLPVAAQDAAEFEPFVKVPADSVRVRFGPPDAVAYHEANDAEVWTYYHGSTGLHGAVDERRDVPAEEVLQVGLAPGTLDIERASGGYTQFAFWNGLVAAVSTTRTDAEAAPYYARSIAYLEARASWLGFGPSGSNYRVTRLGDNVWTAFRTLSERRVQAVLTIGDAEYLRCEKTDAAERARVKAQFGVTFDERQ